MKFKFLFVAALVVSFNVSASNLNENVDWAEVSKVPAINEEIPEINVAEAVSANQMEADTQDYKNDEFESDNNEDVIAELDFLKPKTDERIFLDFKAKFKILDKNTDRVSKREVKFTEPVLLFKGYNIEVESCAKVKVLGVENDIAFVEVKKGAVSLFKGWMCNINKSISFPELRDLYITLQSCQHYTPPVADVSVNDTDDNLVEEEDQIEDNQEEIDEEDLDIENDED